MTDWTVAGFTHRGRLRLANEDAFTLDTRVLAGDMNSPIVMMAPNDSCLMMIAGGMDGHAQGAMAPQR